MQARELSLIVPPFPLAVASWRVMLGIQKSNRSSSPSFLFARDVPEMYQNAAFLAVFLLIYSAVAGRIERSLISGPIVFTVVGFILGPDGFGVLRINITGEGLRLLAELTLAMVLFTDAATRILVSSGAIWVSPSDFLGSVCR